MQIFVQTRGAARASDYCFLGRAPHSPWWRSYREHTTFDHPTLLVHSDGARWRAYLSGIPSERVDAVGTIIRYTVALEGVCGNEEAAANECTLAFVDNWLSDIAKSPTGGQVQAAFDREFPLEAVERLIAEEGNGVWEETQQRAMNALAALPVPHPSADTGPPAWIGNIKALAPRSEFQGRAAQLLAGTPGRALFLNLVGSREDGDALVEDDLPLAILGEDVAGVVVGQIEELQPKKAPSPPRSTHQVATPKARMPLMRWLTAVFQSVRRWFP